MASEEKPEHVEHIERAEDLLSKADQMPLGTPDQVIALAQAHTFLAIAKTLGDFWEEEFSE